jgi:hypothetical protein
LQQRQNESAKDFLDRCKKAWYGLLRKLRTKYTEQIQKDAHDDTWNECIKCMFICGMWNDVRMAVESIADNTNTLDTALAAAIHYKSELNIGGQKQGGAHRYGQVAALQTTGEENAAAQASSSNGSAAGKHEIMDNLAEIKSALASIGVQKKGGIGKPPGGAPPRGRRKPPLGSTAGGAGSERTTTDALGPQHARDWIKCYNCRQWGQHIAAECMRTQAECDKLTAGTKLPPSGPARDSLFNPN